MSQHNRRADDKPQKAAPSQVIIKKIKKVSGHGHHGGSWKVAYADFVTAMMAFFLLMWLLNSTSEEQKRGISNYFGPYGHSMGAGGSGGVMGGLTLQKDGIYTDDKKSISQINPAYQVDPDMQQGDGFVEDGRNTNKKTPSEKSSVNAAKMDQLKKEEAKKASDANLKKMADDYQNKLFEEVESNLRQAIASDSGLKDLAKNLLVEKTPEGLRIQIVDENGLSMFPSGSAEMYDYTKKLLQKVGSVIQKLPNKISITGHTDAKPFSNSNSYGNWELSTDRANASRRALINFQVVSDRITSVVGKADTEPLIATDPESERNRRISIVLLREGDSLPTNKGQAAKVSEAEGAVHTKFTNALGEENRLPRKEPILKN